MAVHVIPVRELNQNTSAVLTRVQTGEELLISVSGKPVARLSPLEPAEDYLRELALRGQAVLATDSSPFPMPAVIGDPSVSVAELYAQQREDEERW
ncbi:MAG TPA: type II toxin-antitoxin system prevent-host-death family antitoxin [Actinospica sp.]|jgi:prevent-host-death family protein|nr:type II toxin-antitoxin system prevent-host-death family antitoxin [Actinospica sp.]